MRYELHLQWKNLRFDDLIEIENRLVEGLSSKGEVSGHEIGRDEADIFISTDDPQGIFEEARAILVSLGHWDGVRAAFCETSEDEYTALWPQTPAAALTQHVPAYFPMNTFSLGSQIGGHVPSEVLREEQRLRDAFNLWQGKYSTAIGQFAFILRVDGSLLRYTELWKIKGPQKAKLKKGWVELEIGVPQSRWQNDSVERYKKHLAQAIEEGLHSMIELLKKKHQEVERLTLKLCWPTGRKSGTISSAALLTDTKQAAEVVPVSTPGSWITGKVRSST